MAANGIRVTLPRGWTVAEKSLTPNLGDPLEILAAGTFELTPNHGSACAQFPVTATEEMGKKDAFVVVGERSIDWGVPGPGLARPPSFSLPKRSSNDEWPQCLSERRDFYHWINVFVDNGRMLYLYVAMGSNASSHTRQEVTDFLNSMMVGAAEQWPMWLGRTSKKSLGISFSFPITCCSVHWLGDPSFDYGQTLVEWTSEQHRSRPRRCPRPAPGGFVVSLSEYRQIPGEPLYADDYHQRPEEFDLTPPKPFELRHGCAPQPDSLIKFSDSGRYLYVHVLWGEGAYERHETMVEALLDSLKIAPLKAESLAAVVPTTT